MAELFEKDSDTIGLHLKNIYKSEELDENSTTDKYSVVQKEGRRKVERKINHYNLDAIISVGYRVNSKRGIVFRKWATQLLKDLRIPPSDRLEKLSGDLKEFYSVRINKQWRIIFTWNNGNANEVRIIDYH